MEKLVSLLKVGLPLAGLILITGCASQRVSTAGNQTAQPALVSEMKAAPEDASEEIFTIVEQMPQFPGGDAALYEFLAKHLEFPTNAEGNKQEGRVVVQFNVMKDGSIKDAEVLRNASPELDKEALRVIGLMPKWQPGKQNGQPVNVRFVLPVLFRLD